MNRTHHFWDLVVRYWSRLCHCHLLKPALPATFALFTGDYTLVFERKLLDSLELLDSPNFFPSVLRANTEDI